MKITPKRIRQRYAALQQRDSRRFAKLKLLAKHLAPERFRGSATEHSDDPGLMDEIRNSEPLQAMSVIVGGMFSGTANPATRWSAMAHPDPDVQKKAEVAKVLSRRDDAAFNLLAQSNFYSAYVTAIEDAVFSGTGLLIADEIEHPRDGEAHAHFISPLPGTYHTAASRYGVTDTCFRSVVMTVEEIEERFGTENATRDLKNLVKQERWDDEVELLHVITPNPDHDSDTETLGPDAFLSLWLETKAPEDHPFLDRAGYRENPLIEFVWKRSDGDTGSTGPGWRVYPDCAELQETMDELALVKAKIAEPPLQGPSVGYGQVEGLPGQFTPLDNANATITELHKTDTRAINVLLEDVARLEAAIRRGLYADFFLAISGDDRTQPLTATEANLRQAEKLQTIGSTADNFNRGLRQVMRRALGILTRAGLLPPARDSETEALLRDAKVEFRSAMSQAQRMVGYRAAQAFLADAVGLSETFPETRHRVDAGESIRILHAKSGAPAAMLRSEAEAKKLAQAEQEQQQKMAKAKIANEEAKGLKAMNAVDMGGGKTAANAFLEGQIGKLAAGQRGTM